MNRLYKVMWCAATNSYVVVSELVRNGNRKIKVALTSGILFLFVNSISHAAYIVTDNDGAYGAFAPSGSRSTAAGYSANASGSSSLALGRDVVSGGSSSVAIGRNTSSAGTSSVSLGYGSNSSAENSVAIGTNAMASALNAMAFGSGAKATYAGSVALGNNANAASVSSIVISAGGINGSTVTQANGDYSIVLGNDSSASSSYNILLGQGSIISGTSPNAIVLGANSSVSGSSGMALGSNSRSTVAYSVAIGSGSRATTLSTGSYGVGASATTAYGIFSVGDTGVERRIQSVAAGVLSTTSTDAVNGSQLYQTNTQVAGNTQSITNLNNGTVGLVQQDPSTLNVTVAKDTGGTLIDLTGTDGTRKLTGVSAGTVSGSSTDALNGSQLFATNSAVVSALGGGAALDGSGAITAPSYSVQSGTYSNVGDALGALDTATTGNTTNISGLQTAVNNLNSGVLGLVQYDPAINTVTIGAFVGGSRITVSGTDGDRVITGVSAGDINATSTDAVNGSQLYIVNQSVSSLQGDVNNIKTGASGLVTYNNTNKTVNIGANKGGSQIIISGTDGNRIISGLANGVNDDDAVTVAQLNSVKSNIGSSAQLAIKTDSDDKNASATGERSIAMGGNSVSSGNGSIALGGTSSSTGNNATAVGNNSQAAGLNSSAFGSGSKAFAENSVALGYGSIADRENTVSVGSAGRERKITNVAAGTYDTDAVNVGQLKRLQEATNSSFRKLDKKINRINNKLTGGIASAIAMAGLPQAYEPDSNMMGMAISGYDNKSALAAGVTHISENGLWVTKASFSTNTESDFSASLGIGYQW